MADKIQKIRNLDPAFQTIHLISIGGWNAPHPVTTHSAEDVYQSWRDWNTVTIARPDKGFYGKKITVLFEIKKKLSPLQLKK